LQLPGQGAASESLTLLSNKSAAEEDAKTAKMMTLANNVLVQVFMDKHIFDWSNLSMTAKQWYL